MKKGNTLNKVINKRAWMEVNKLNKLNKFL